MTARMAGHRNRDQILIEGDRLWYLNNRSEVVCFDIAPLKKGTGKPTDPTQGFLDIGYDASGDPRQIHLSTREVPSITDVDVFAYADGQSRIDLDFTDVKGAHITATSKFLITGAGRSQVAVQSGIFADQVSECWDPTYCRTYIKDNAGWTNPPCAGAFCELGTLSSCPVVH